jgi:tetratricopeptide (TPR) repeat protein
MLLEVSTEIETLPALPGPPTPEEEVLYGRGQDARVFVSSQMRSGAGKVYETERAKLRDEIDAIPRFRAWLWERDAPVGDYSSERVCVRVAATSDCLILAVGRELTDITRKEYAAAQAAEAHCFIFQDSRVAPDAAVKAFIEAERGRAACTGHFSSAEDLARQAVEHLLGRAVHFLRLGTVAQRRHATTRMLSTSVAVASMSLVEDRGAAWSEAPARKYEEDAAGFLESPGMPETYRSVTDIVAEQRERAERGEYEAAFSDLRDMAFALYEMGRGDLALEVLEDLHAIVPAGRMTPAEDAWVLNVEALAASLVGKHQEARQLWLRMLGVGERLDDKSLRAIAMQNLGNSAMEAGDLRDARRYLVGSIQLMQELGEMRSLLQLLNSIALLAIEENDYERAAEELDVYEQMARQARDPYLLTSAHGNRGRLLVAQGQFDAAEREFREALRYSRKTGAPVSQVLGLQSMGAVCADTERYGPAMRWYRKGIRLAETYELPVHVEVLRRSLATVLHAADRNREAIAEFDRARQVAWELGDQSLWAQSTMNMGATYLLAGDSVSAMEPLEKAASTFRELGELDWELRAQRNIAAVLAAAGQRSAALDVVERGLTLLSVDAHEERATLLREAAETGLVDPDLRSRVVDLFERALDEEALYLDAGDVARRAATIGSFLSETGAEQAPQFYDRSVALVEAGPSGFGRSDYSLATALNDRAVGLERLGRHDDARADIVRCVQLIADSRDDVLRQKALANLSEVERQRGDLPAAVDAARSALSLARELGDDEATVHALLNLSSAFEDSGSADEAEAVLKELQELAEAHNVLAWKASAAAGFGCVAFLRGDYDRAAEQYRTAAAMHRGTDSDGLVSALGGLLESLGRAGQRDGLQATMQELVDIVNGADAENVVNYFARCGISWLELGELEEASSLLGTGLLLGARELVSGPGPKDIESGARPFCLAVCYAVLAATNSARFDEDAVYDTLIRYVNNHESGVGDALRPYLQMAREAVELRATSPG